MKRWVWVCGFSALVALPAACGSDDDRLKSREEEGGEGGGGSSSVPGGAGDEPGPALGGNGGEVGLPDAGGAAGTNDVGGAGSGGDSVLGGTTGNAGDSATAGAGAGNSDGEGGSGGTEPETGLLQVSLGAINGNAANIAIYVGASADGSHVYFFSAEQLTNDDQNDDFDLYQRAGGTTTLLTGGSLIEDPSVTWVGATPDGSRVYFETTAPFVTADTDGAMDVYEWFNGAVTLISGGTTAQAADYLAVSANGQRVFFRTQEPLLPSDADGGRFDIYERFGGALTHITSEKKDGASPDDALFRGISQDGLRVFFDTFEEVMASDSETGGASVDSYEVFGGQTFHRTAGNNLLESTGIRAISRDGLHMIYETQAAMDAVADTDTLNDIYDHFGGVNSLLSTGAVSGAPQGAGFVGASADGTTVIFETTEALAATDLDTNNDFYARSGNQTLQVSLGALNNETAVSFQFRAISSDGSRVFFTTSAQLVAGDTDGALDIYLRSGGQTTLVSPARLSGPASGIVFQNASADGQRVYFTTNEVLVAEDADATSDLYVWQAGVVTLLSTGTTQAIQFLTAASDGSRAFFSSDERVALTDTDDSTDIFSVTPP